MGNEYSVCRKLHQRCLIYMIWYGLVWLGWVLCCVWVLSYVRAPCALLLFGLLPRDRFLCHRYLSAIANKLLEFALLERYQQPERRDTRLYHSLTMLMMTIPCSRFFV